MAVLQAWPGRGFWQGTVRGQPGTLAGMTVDMAGTPAAAFPVRHGSAAFATFDQAHGFAVNLVAVIALAVDRRRVPDRPAAADPAGARSASPCCAWRTGC